MGAVISSCCLNNGSISCHTRASGSSGLLLLSVSGMAGFVGSCATHHPLSEMRRKKRAFQPPSSPHCSQQSTWCTCDKTEFEVNVCFQTDDNHHHHHHHRRFYEYYMVLWVWHPIILKKCDCCTQRFLMPPFFFFFFHVEVELILVSWPGEHCCGFHWATADSAYQEGLVFNTSW